MIWFLCAVLSFGLVPLGLVLFNLCTWSRRESGSRREATAGTPHLHVGVLVPARNEEANISALLESVLTYRESSIEIVEVLVYDDSSLDRTASLVQQKAQTDERVRLIEGRPLPVDWVGKPHACHQLLASSTATHLLYLDADVRLKPGGLGRLATMLPSKAGPCLITAVPEQQTKSLLEVLLIPLLHLTYMSWLPLRYANRRSDPRTVAACGQIMFAPRETFVELGGFEAVRSDIVDDVALCRQAKKMGIPTLFVDGFDVAFCRMYRSGRQLWRGFSKNLYLGLNSKLALFIAVTLYFSAFLSPYVFLIFAGLFGLDAFAGAAPLLISATACGIFANLMLRIALAVTYRHQPISVLLHPVGVFLLILLSFNSFWWVIKGKVSWAGRVYQPGHPLRTSLHRGEP